MFVDAGMWPLDSIPGEEAEPPALLQGPGQSWAARKQVPMTRYAMLPGGSPGNVALTKAWVRLVQVPNLLPGPRKAKTKADMKWAQELGHHTHAKWCWAGATSSTAHRCKAMDLVKMQAMIREELAQLPRWEGNCF